MGQGYSLTTLSAASASIDVPELADLNLSLEKTLSSARFMKSVRARNSQGFVFVKAVVKPYTQFDIQQYVLQILRERDALATIPNALGYQRIVETGTGGFLVRQYMHSSVYDRLSTRPFLEDIEKKWLAFQLLSVVRDCHAQNIYHGDIKTENLLVTSWNWLFLTDFSSSFKPTILPEDNPADFSFYFDTGGRRTCYLAPERFTVNGVADPQSDITWAMDIFSVGCTIAEIFLEGPVFSLSQLFKYRAGSYSPEALLSKIEDVEVKNMLLNMIEINPEKRYSAEQHLSFYKTKIFPEYFFNFLHQYMLDLTDPSSGRKPITLDISNFGEADERIERVYNDFDKISFFLGYPRDREGHGRPQQPTDAYQKLAVSERASPVDVDNSSYDGTLLFLTIIVSSIRNTAKATARQKASDLLVAFAARLPDEAKLDRVLPYFASLLNDPSDRVKVAAIQSLTAVLGMVQVVSPINAYVYPEYIFPKLKHFILSPVSQPSVIVRATYASCLASLALSSSRILDMVQAIRADGRLPSLAENDWAPESSYHGLYDVARAELVPHFEEATKSLITDPETSVRRAFLGSVTSLCVFFGSARTSDVILSHLNTYLNDKDWILKCSFYDALVGVAAYVGGLSLEKFILPVMVQSLTDPQIYVVEKVFRSLARMASLGLLQKSVTWELVSIAVRFLIHPSIWIRESATQFIISSSRYLSLADKHCIVMPQIQPFLETPMRDLTEESILDSIKSPLSRVVFDSAVGWAQRSTGSAFWEAAKRDSVFLLAEPEASTIPSLITKRLVAHIPRSQLGKEDQQPLSRLRELGLTRDDEMKLLALREYIYKIAHSEESSTSDSRHKLLGDIISLNQIQVTPQNVFFDSQDPVREVHGKPENLKHQHINGESHTIADALLEASSMITDQSSKRQVHISQDGQNTLIAMDGKTVSAVPNIAIQDEGSGMNTPVDDATTGGKKRSGSGNSTPGIQSDDLSSNERDSLAVRRTSSLALRRHNSAINLLSKHERAKAGAAVATNPENAFGRLDGPIQSRKSKEHLPLTAVTPSPANNHLPVYAPNHSYTGNDSNVLHLLNTHFVENFPVDHLDFGPTRRPIEANEPIRKPSDSATQAAEVSQTEQNKHPREPWHPSGHLLTLYSEHTAAINRVVAAPDHAFFVTASDDGTCKIWDTTRLEKNITPRSRYTHRHAQGAKVRTLCFIENTHCFVSAATDGSIQVVKIDYKSIDGGESTRYGKAAILRNLQLPQTLGQEARDGQQEYAVWLHHYRTPTSQSILLAATTHHRVLAIDLKSQNLDIVYTLSNPIHHGTPTTFCIDKKHHWLLLATSHGILDLWDLRFRLRLRSFGIQRHERIDRLLVHPSKGLGKRVIVSSGGEISVWDIEKIVCREVYRPSSWSQPDRGKIKPYQAWYPDEEPREKVLERFAKRLSSDETLINLTLQPESSVPSTPARPSSTSKQEHRTPILTSPALHIITDYLHNPGHPTNPDKHPILMSGGADRTLRYWDISHPESSRIISGPQLDVYEDSPIGDVKSGSKHKINRIKYIVDYPLSVSAGAQIAVVTEVLPQQQQQQQSHNASDNKSSTRSTPSKRSGGGRSGASTPATDDHKGKKPTTATTPTTTAGSAETVSASASANNKLPRNAIISAAQQQLLRTHMDGITDICVLRKPYGCVVSVDRAGCCFVFQ